MCAHQKNDEVLSLPPLCRRWRDLSLALVKLRFRRAKYQIILPYIIAVSVCRSPAKHLSLWKWGVSVIAPLAVAATTFVASLLARANGPSTISQAVVAGAWCLTACFVIFFLPSDLTVSELLVDGPARLEALAKSMQRARDERRGIQRSLGDWFNTIDFNAPQSFASSMEERRCAEVNPSDSSSNQTAIHTATHSTAKASPNGKQKDLLRRDWRKLRGVQ